MPGLSLTSHCQEWGSGLAGWGRGSGFQAASTITVFVPNREFSKEPELMPRTPSQKNRRKKRRISSIQDENRDPIRKRYEGQEAWCPLGELDSKVLTEIRSSGHRVRHAEGNEAGLETVESRACVR